MNKLFKLYTILGALLILLSSSAFAQDKPNILIIWGDGVGEFNISAYNYGHDGLPDPQY